MVRCKFWDLNGDESPVSGRRWSWDAKFSNWIEVRCMSQDLHGSESYLTCRYDGSPTNIFIQLIGILLLCVCLWHEGLKTSPTLIFTVLYYRWMKLQVCLIIISHSHTAYLISWLQISREWERDMGDRLLARLGLYSPARLIRCLNYSTRLLCNWCELSVNHTLVMDICEHLLFDH